MYRQDLSTSTDLEQAWRTFVQDGQIDQDVVRPDIARSWFRCVKQRGMGDIEPLPDRIIRVKQEKNRKLIEAARSILHDVAVMLTSSMQHFSVILLDNEGDIIEMINHNTNLICLGHHCSEMKSGTNAGGIALVDGVGVEVVGYEHLYPFAHNWHTIGVPIRNANNGIAGVFGVLHVDGPCPVLTMQTVSLGAQLIETRLQRDQLFMDVSSLMVERILEPAVLVNQYGLMLDLNQQFAGLLQTDRDLLLGENICNYWAGDFNENTLLSSGIHMDNPMKILIKSYGNEQRRKSCLCDLNKYIIKPDNDSSLILFTMSRSEHYDQLESLEDLNGRRKASAFDQLIGNHPAFLRVIEDAQRAAQTASNVLIEGKSGTGKELMARAIHQESKRSGTFLAINCGSIPKELLHSELFGYEEGAFTGAKKGGSPGKFELANGGTLFLDEIGEMPLDMQVSLLRFLEDKTVTRMGGHKAKTVDVRIVAATNRNLAEEVQKGNFREDLFYRINVVYLKMPCLWERKEDIPLLIKQLLYRLELKNNSKPIQLRPDVMNRLCAHDWPGNVRELQNVLESSAILAGDGPVTMACLPEYLRENNGSVKINPGSSNLKEVEKAMILDTLSKYNDNISKTAQELGITRTTLYNKIEQLGIKRSKVAY
ncbi:MAG: sigma-54 interaction domain-containing protein [Methanobacterium sp.]